MVKLRRVYESDLFLESQKDLDDLKDHLGDDLYNDYMKIRDKIPKDQNDYKDFQKLKKLPISDVQDFVDNFQSESERRKEAKKGAQKLYEDSDWLVLKITTYPAAVEYGKNTKWCITGRYPGHEWRGEEYFNDYIDQRNLDGGYYFYISKKDPKEKYCVLQTRDRKIDSIWDSQDTDQGNSAYFLDVKLPYVKEVGLETVQITDLFSAIREGDLDIVKDCFNKDLVNVRGSNGTTPLLLAIGFSNLDIAEFLLKNGADVNMPDQDGNTPLINACLNEDLDLVKMLVKYGADINVKTKYGTPLECISDEKIKHFLNQYSY